MDSNSIIQISAYFFTIGILAWPLGIYIARVLEGDLPSGASLLRPLERLLYRLSCVEEDKEMSWQEYARAMLTFNMFGLIAVYLFQRVQEGLPLNPQALPAVSTDSSFNTAVSFASNTNWQGYGGESTMSYLTQMAGLGVQNFLSAATGIAIFAALVRGLTRKEQNTIGSFWTDVSRATIYVLFPLSVLLAVTLVSQGVIQSFSPYATGELVQRSVDANGSELSTQLIPLGPAASQIAIKQLGTNGGGFFNVNSAHPFENPTPVSNFLEMVSILLIPVALCHTFGRLVRDARQGWAILIAMTLIFTPLALSGVIFEQSDSPVLSGIAVEQSASELQSGGNMEGKEVRFGIVSSALWAAATTAASNGSVNSMHDSFTPLGGMVPMLLMQFSEVIYGGVGCGLYGMLSYAIVAVFIAGLMVGRTPEYLGKKIEAYEMKMVSIVVLVPCALVLIGTAIGVGIESIRGSISNPGAHGFSQVLYAYSSMGNNNGSAFAGFGANVPVHNFAGGVAMFISRFWIAIPILALAGSLAGKKVVPASSGTLPTHTPLFVTLLVCVVVMVGALTFVPALALGPIVEQLQFIGR
jgi:K+-transporting ATPase ATPase A chain